MANIFHIERADNKITLGTTGTTINMPSHTASQSLALDASKNLESINLSAVYQPLDTGLTSLAGLTYASDSFIKVTAEDTYAIRTIAQTKTDLSLNNVENTQLSTWAGTTNITTLGTIATVGNITIANGGTIGQAAGPLLTFDDTNNYLEITGCKVGIGIAAPTCKLVIIEDAYDAVFIRNTDGADASTLGMGINTTSGYAYIQSRNDAAGVIQPLTFWVGGSTRAVDILTDGGIKMSNLKSGVNQAGAGAAANELWVDTADNSIKIGV